MTVFMLLITTEDDSVPTITLYKNEWDAKAESKRLKRYPSLIVEIQEREVI